MDGSPTQKNWRNLGNKYNVQNKVLNYLACNCPRTKVQEMFNMSEFVNYTEDQLIADLKEFKRTDILEDLRADNHIDWME